MQNPLARKLTVSSVMGAFTKTINDLGVVADNNEQIVTNLQFQQEKIASDMAEARSEADNARKISAKLQKIVGTEAD